jgi:hypothetical protein
MKIFLIIIGLTIANIILAADISHEQLLIKFNECLKIEKNSVIKQPWFPSKTPSKIGILFNDKKLEQCIVEYTELADQNKEIKQAKEYQTEVGPKRNDIIFSNQYMYYGFFCQKNEPPITQLTHWVPPTLNSIIDNCDTRIPSYTNVTEKQLNAASKDLLIEHVCLNNFEAALKECKEKNWFMLSNKYGLKKEDLVNIIDLLNKILSL